MATVDAHITGTVWSVEVEVGQIVREGEVVAILESMKMEMPIETPAAGMVAEIFVGEGTTVAEGVPLLRLE